MLSSNRVTLRELAEADAPALWTALSATAASRFIAEPPTTVDGFERFIRCMRQQRRVGRAVCYGVVPAGHQTPIGLFQVRPLEPGFGVVEWGFAFGQSHWGTGLFVHGAQLVLDFLFNGLGTYRVEARSAIRNGRGNGALRKLGARCEGVLRGSFRLNGEYLDQHLWSILASDWTIGDCGLEIE